MVVDMLLAGSATYHNMCFPRSSLSPCRITNPVLGELAKALQTLLPSACSLLHGCSSCNQAYVVGYAYTGVVQSSVVDVVVGEGSKLYQTSRKRSRIGRGAVEVLKPASAVGWTSSLFVLQHTTNFDLHSDQVCKLKTVLTTRTISSKVELTRMHFDI